MAGKKGQYVWTEGQDEEALSLGVYNTYTSHNLRYSQVWCGTFSICHFVKRSDYIYCNDNCYRCNGIIVTKCYNMNSLGAKRGKGDNLSPWC